MLMSCFDVSVQRPIVVKRKLAVLDGTRKGFLSTGMNKFMAIPIGGVRKRFATKRTEERLDLTNPSQKPFLVVAPNTLRAHEQFEIRMEADLREEVEFQSIRTSVATGSESFYRM